MSPVCQVSMVRRVGMLPPFARVPARLELGLRGQRVSVSVHGSGKPVVSIYVCACAWACAPHL